MSAPDDPVVAFADAMHAAGIEPPGALALLKASSFECALPEESARDLKIAAARIRALSERMTMNIISIGVELIAAKNMLGHGQFGPWLEAEFRWSERTAERFMQAAEVFGEKSDTVSVLDPTAIYLLSAPSTPDKVRKDVLARLERGEAMSAEGVRTLVSIARAEVRQVKKHNISKQKRRARERRRASDEKLRQEHEARKSKADAAAAELVDLLRHHLGDQIARFLSLVETAVYSHSMQGIARRIAAEIEGGRR